MSTKFTKDEKRELLNLIGRIDELANRLADKLDPSRSQVVYGANLLDSLVRQATKVRYWLEQNGKS